MAIARIDNGAIVEIRDLEMSDVPQHKRALWLPVVVEGEGPHQSVSIDAGAAVRIRRSTPVPAAVTPYQARRVLTERGLRAAVEAAVAAGSQDMRDAWEYATVVERASPFIQQLRAALDLTEADVDAMFKDAAQVQ